MATPPSLGSRPPLRTGGIALLGLGAVAAAMGLYTAATGGDGEGTLAQAPPPSVALAPTPEVVPPTLSAIAAPPAVTAPPGATAPFVTGDGAGTAGQPTAGVVPSPAERTAAAAAEPAPRAGAAGEGTSATNRSPLRVYNNSTITGLAARAAGDFRGAGWTVTEIGGFPGADLPTSTVYYRSGTDEEAAAQEIGRAFGLRVEPRFAAIEQASPGVIVIVTKEYRSPGPN